MFPPRNRGRGGGRGGGHQDHYQDRGYNHYNDNRGRGGGPPRNQNPHYGHQPNYASSAPPRHNQGDRGGYGGQRGGYNNRGRNQHQQHHQQHGGHPQNQDDIMQRQAYNRYAIRISSVAAQTTREDLIKFFTPSGQVKNVNIIQRGDKYVAFVNFFNEQSVVNATRNKHETVLHGVKLNITKQVANPSDKTKLMDVFVTGHPEEMTNEDLRVELENLSGVPCIRVSNKGKYLFYQVQGKENYDLAMANLNGARMSCGNELISQPGRRKGAGNNQQQQSSAQLAKILNQLATQSGILPVLDDKSMHLLERSVRTVHLSMLSKDTSKQDIQEAFKKYGELEEINIVVKDNFHTGYGFVVFTTHKSCREFRNEGLRNITVKNVSARIATSKPAKNIIDIATISGLLDIDNNPTTLFFQLLESAQSHLAAMTGKNPDGAVAGGGQMMYVQDANGQVYGVTPEHYQQICAQQGIQYNPQEAQKTAQQYQQQLYQQAAGAQPGQQQYAQQQQQYPAGQQQQQQQQYQNFQQPQQPPPPGQQQQQHPQQQQQQQQQPPPPQGYNPNQPRAPPMQHPGQQQQPQQQNYNQHPGMQQQPHQQHPGSNQPPHMNPQQPQPPQQQQPNTNQMQNNENRGHMNPERNHQMNENAQKQGGGSWGGFEKKKPAREMGEAKPETPHIPPTKMKMKPKHEQPAHSNQFQQRFQPY